MGPAKQGLVGYHLGVLLILLMGVAPAQDPDFLLSVTPLSAQACIPDDAVYTADVGSILGYSDPVTLSSVGQPAAASSAFSVNPVIPSGSSLLTISNTGAASPGDYTISIVGVAPTSTHTSTVSLALFSATPAQAVLTSPSDDALDVPVLPSLIWNSVGQAASYQVQLSEDPAFNSLVLTENVALPGLNVTNPLQQNTKYYWKVQPGNACGSADFSAPFSFTTGSADAMPPSVPDFALLVTPGELEICTPNDAVFAVGVGSLLGYGDVVTLNSAGQPANTATSFSSNPVIPPGSSTFTVSNTGAAAPGNYLVSIVGVAPTSTHTSTVSLSLFDGSPGQVVLSSPVDGATGVSVLPTFGWSDASQASKYEFQIASDATFSSLLLTSALGAATFTVTSPLGQGTTYYWRVQPGNACGLQAFSTPFSFTTEGGVDVQTAPIPTLSSTGILVLSVILLLSGIILMRRGSKASS